VIYANSGTESTDVMIRFSRFVTKRRRFLYLEGGFHGRSFGAISVCGFPELREGQDPFMPECTAVKPNDLRALRRELKQGDVAGFIIEPVQRLTGLALDRGYMREAEILCRQAGVLLLADESHSGLGRTGHWFRTTGLGIRPDMMSVSSVLSGGAVPVAAVMMTDKVYNDVYTSLTSGPIYFSTFAENNMAMAAAMTTLEVLDELEAPTLAAQRSEQLRTRLTEIAEKFDVIDHLGGAGLMLSIPFGDSIALSEAGIDVPDSQAFAAAIANELYSKHRVAMQLAGPNTNALIALPPVTITDDEMVWFTNAVESVLTELYAGQGGVPATIQAITDNENFTGILPIPVA
jgi:acetylornithine/succinyldiaminopimelate/putrescine aminotransferase